MALLGWVLSTFDWGALRTGTARVLPTTVAAAVALSVLTQIGLSARWYVMIRRFIPGSPLWHMRHYFRATFFNLVTPGATGADIYRVVVLGYTRGDSAGMVGLIFRERVVGLLGYCLFYLTCLGAAVVAAASGTGSAPPAFFIRIGGAIGVGAAAVAAAPFAGPRLLKFAPSWMPDSLARRLCALSKTLRWCSPGEFALILGLTLVSCGTWAGVAKVFGDNLGVAVSLPVLGMIAILAELVRLIPLSIQGLGVREAAYAFCAGLLRQSPEAGFLMGALAYLVNALVLALAGVAATGRWMEARAGAAGGAGHHA